MNSANTFPPTAQQQGDLQPPSSQSQPDARLSKSVEKAWNARFSSHREQDRKKFESLACNSLDEYLKKLEDACTEHRKESKIFQTFDWFEPLFKVVEIFTCAAAIAVDAHPSPAALILGGIVAVMQTTSRLLQYQKLTVRMLTRMGIKARALAAYEYDLYQENEDVQHCIVKVVGDILEFCLTAIEFLTENGLVRAKVKHLALMIVSNYDAMLGKEVEAFELHVEELETMTTLCDKRRLQNILDSQMAHRRDTEQTVIEMQAQYSEFRAELFNKQQLLEKQKMDRQRRQHRERLLDWLSPLKFKIPYEQRRRNHLAGTGSWFLDSAAYKGWKSTNRSDLLWIKGKPGCGKSVLAALAIMDISADLQTDMAMAYAICQRDNQASQTWIAVLGALAKQIVEGVPDIDQILDGQYVVSQRADTAGPQSLEAVYDVAMDHFSEIYVVIDALDECQEYKELAEELQRLMNDIKRPKPIKIMVFSRPESSLERVFGGCTQMNPAEFNGKDLEAYIYSRFPEEKTGVSRTIRKMCLSKADGMFLWVKLLADMLDKRPLTDKQKLKRINAIPTQLGSMYDAVLQEICDQDEDTRDTAFRVLLWTTYAHPPLKGRQMLEAVADSTDAVSQEDLDRHSKPEDLVTLCGNLVFLDPNGDMRLIHESVRGYLGMTDPSTEPLRLYRRQITDIRTVLTTACLRYLLLEDFGRGSKKTKDQLLTFIQKYPFFDYAACHWTSYMPEVGSERLQTLINQFTRSQPHRELAMQVFKFQKSDGKELRNFNGSSSEVHVLALYGLRLAENLHPAERTFHSMDSYGLTPLDYALSEGHHSTVMWLLTQLQSPQGLKIALRTKEMAAGRSAELGWADALEILLSDDPSLIATIDRDGWSLLSWACSRYRTEAAEVLINHNADLSVASKTGVTALIAATICGDVSSVQLLLLNGADPGLQDSKGYAAIHHAAYRNYANLAKMLLESSGESLLLMRDHEGETALHKAAQTNAIETLQVLLRTKSDATLMSSDGSTALHIAAGYGSTGVAQELVDIGVDVNVIDNAGQTPFYIAASRGHMRIVRMLIDANCELLTATSTGRTSLHGAVYSEKVLTLTWIRERLSTQDWRTLAQQCTDIGSTPLHVATVRGNEKFVRLLLDAEPNVRMRTCYGWTPLHLAANCGHGHLCNALLQHAEDANPRNLDGDTPLHMAARMGQLAFLRQYFKECSDRGLEIERLALNRRMHSALSAAFDNGHERVAEFLIDKGCALIVRDHLGNMPHHEAAWLGFDRVLDALLRYDGASARGFRGRTPLWFAAARNHCTAVNALFHISPETLDIPDELGLTPVSIALANGHVDMANHLLDLGANAKTQSNKQVTLLHLAASCGDKVCVERLISLGCKGDAPDWLNRTPLSCAVDNGHLEATRVLLANKPHAADLQDDFGNSPTILAASTGNLELLQSVSVNDSCIVAVDKQGRNAAYWAAKYGHQEILEYLVQNNVTPHMPDVNGVTPLMMAAEIGYVENVRYLAQLEPSRINDRDILGFSPVAKAMINNNIGAARALLLAGAHPPSCYGFGVSCQVAISPRYVTAQMTGDECYTWQKNHSRCINALRDLVRRCCVGLLALPNPLAADVAEQRYEYNGQLAQALNLLGDGAFARYCFMEYYWPPYRAMLIRGRCCELCHVNKFESDIFVCKICPRVAEICQICFKGEEQNDSVAWDAAKSKLQLEKRVQPIRIAASRYSSITTVGSAANMFKTGRQWLGLWLEKFEAWEHRFASIGSLRNIDYPGKEFLEMLAEWRILGEKNSARSVLQQSQDDLNRKYKAHRRRYRADKDIPEVPCRDHEFLLVSQSEHAKAKSEGHHFDTITGRLRNEFFRAILNKYTESEASDQSNPNDAEEASRPAHSLPNRASTLPTMFEETASNQPIASSNFNSEVVPMSTSQAGERGEEEGVPSAASLNAIELTSRDGEDKEGVEENEAAEEEAAFRRRVEAAFWLQEECHENEEDKIRWFLAVDILRAMSKDYAEDYLTSLEERQAEEDGCAFVSF